MLVLEDWTINPPPPDERFTPINNAAQTQVITDARFPGLEIRLPAGVNIVGWDGVTKTRIAVERVDIATLPVPPPPVPVGEAYQLYFGTPMGGLPSAPIPVTLPNEADSLAEPGDAVDIWYFDGSPMGGSGEWKIAGQGIVSADGTTIRMPDNGGIPRFCGVCGLMCAAKGQSGANTGKGCPKSSAGNPVNLFSGQELPDFGGLSCSGLTPIEMGMSYNPVDAFNNIAGTAGAIGLGWTLDYDIAFLPFQGPQKRLILPPNEKLNFVDVGSGNYRNSDDPRFDGAVMRATNASANLWELTFKDGRKWRFAPFPGIPGVIRGGPPTFVTEMVDTAGNVLNITRQSNGRITSIGTSERNVTLTYGTNGFVSEMRDSAGRSQQYTYTASNRIGAVTDADGKVMSFTYVNDNEIAPDPVCAASMSSMGERIKTIAYPGRPDPTVNFYGSSRRVLRQTGYDGREFQFAYKVSGACVTNVSQPGVKCSGPACPAEDSWDAFQAGWRFHGGRVLATTVTQPDGTQETHEFTSVGALQNRIDASGQAMQYQRDSANRVSRQTDALGRTTSYTYDANGNVVESTDALGRVTRYTYDTKWNRVASITRFNDDGTPQVRRFDYDATTGQLTRSTTPLGHATTFGLSPRGEIESITDPLNHITRFNFTEPGDLIAIEDALGNTLHSTFDEVGRPVSQTDPLGYLSTSTYNGIDQPTRFVDPRGGETTLAYDGAQRLATVTNPLNNTIEAYQYDAGDRLVSRTDALGRATTYTYDAAGRLETMTDRNGQVSTYSYDARGRVTSIDRTDGTTRYTYDAIDRLIQIDDPAGSIEYRYDAVDRLIRETQRTGASTTEVGYAYDALDRRIRRTVNGADATEYDYDLDDRLTGIRFRDAVTRYAYDAAGRLTEKTLPNGIRQTFTYDEANRLTLIQLIRSDATVIDAIGYIYDANSQRIAKTFGVAPAPETPFTAEYNAANRMTGITLDPGSVTEKNYTLTYDTNGNLIRKANTANPAEVTIYTWDNQNRLTGITSAGVNATFAYDALGRRIERTVNGETTRYVYDGVQAIAELRSAQTTHLLTGLQIDEMIARYTGASQRAYLTDALGSVIGQAREDQSIQNWYGYSPYGEVFSGTDDEGNDIEYTARENDGTGLYYYRARYYDPVLKRFVSEDPIGLEGGLNTYLYADGNPNSFIDPLGLYGTTSCAYYSQACERSGGYACAAQYICPVFPEGEENGWWQCVRQCLQEEHHRREEENACAVTDNPYTDHTTCFLACSINSGNPGMPSGTPSRP